MLQISSPTPHNLDPQRNLCSPLSRSNNVASSMSTVFSQADNNSDTDPSVAEPNAAGQICDCVQAFFFSPPTSRDAEKNPPPQTAPNDQWTSA